MLGLGEPNNLCSEGFTECRDCLVKGIARKDHGIITDMLTVQPVASVVIADPASTRNDRKFAPSICITVPYILIQLLQVSPISAM